MNTNNKTNKSTEETAMPIANVLLVAGLSLEKWIEKETKERTYTHWGVEITFSPVICDTIIGDGLQLVYFGTMDQRPLHWLIRIDSNTDIDGDDFDFETLLAPLEECFGRHPENYVDKDAFEAYKNGDEVFGNCLNDYDTYEEYASACEYPAIWYSGGHYGLVVNMVTGEVG